MISKRIVSLGVWKKIWILIIWPCDVAEFRPIMHRAIQDALRKDMDEIQRNGALQLQNGWMHIHGKDFCSFTLPSFK